MNLKLKTLIVVSFSFLSFLLFIGTSIGVYASLTTKQRLEKIHSDYVAIEELIHNINRSADGLDASFLQAAVLGQVDARAVESEMAAIQSAVEELQTSDIPADMDESIQSLYTDWRTFSAQLNSLSLNLEASETGIEQAQIAIHDFSNSIQEIETANRDVSAGQQESADQNFYSIETFVVTSGSIGILITIIVGVYLTRQIFRPIHTLGGRLHQISLGQLVNNNEAYAKLTRRGDELGSLARDLLAVEDYFLSISQIATEMSEGNLGIEAEPRSSDDSLGFALQRMIRQLSGLVFEATEFTQRVHQASDDLSQSARLTDQDTNEITASVGQINDGIGHENRVINEAITLVEKTNLVIAQMNNYTLQQQQAVDETSAVTAQINNAIELVLVNAGNVDTSSTQSAQIARDGTALLNQTIDSVGQIQEQETFFGKKVMAMGEQSRQINHIVDTIEQIATTTNILAINATIESAHAKIQAERMTEELLNQMMVSECQMIQRMLEQGADENPTEFWQDLCTTCSLDTILVTDEDGVVVIANEPALMNWRFPDEPSAQTYLFRKLIPQTNGVYCQEAQARSLDNQVFKYVGISRKDRPGVIQVGFKMASLKRFDLHINGFSVVAEEVYHLAERAHAASKEIRSLVTGIQHATDEAINAMGKSGELVVVSMQKADQAREAIHQILDSINQVLTHTASTIQATRQMQSYTQQLTHSMEIVNKTVKNNQKAAGEMGEGFSFIRQTFKQVASLGENNTAATTQVKATTQGMKTQMKNVVESSYTLAQLSRNLQAVIGKFKLA